jgi:hypothetical protein
VFGFDDTITRAVRSEVDKLAPIRQLFELYVTKCKSIFFDGKIGNNG